MSAPTKLGVAACCCNAIPSSISVVILGCGNFGEGSYTVTLPDGSTASGTCSGSFVYHALVSGTYSFTVSFPNTYSATGSVTVTSGHSAILTLYAAPLYYEARVSFLCPGGGSFTGPYGDTTVTLSGGYSGTCTFPRTGDPTYGQGCRISLPPVAADPGPVTITASSPRFITASATSTDSCHGAVTLATDANCYDCCGCPNPTAKLYLLTTPLGNLTLPSGGSGVLSCVTGGVTSTFTVRFFCASGIAFASQTYHPGLTLYGTTQTIDVDFSARNFTCSPYSWTGTVGGGVGSASCSFGGGGSFPCAAIGCAQGTYTVTEVPCSYMAPIAPLMMAPVPAPLPPKPIGDGRVRVGLVGPYLNNGGAEAMQLALARYADPARVEFVGCVATEGDHAIAPEMRRATEALMPVGSGADAARELASRSDVLVTWAIERADRLLEGLADPPRVVSVCHVPADSPWGLEAHSKVIADRHVAVSELALGAFPEAVRPHAKVIWNAVDLDRLIVRRGRAEMREAWGVPGGAKVAGYLGRLSGEKDPHAMARLAGSLPDGWHVVVVGNGPERVEPRDRLHLVGPDTASGDVLGAFDVLVVPSRYESFGLTLAEGIAAGLPIVSTEVGLAKLAPGITCLVPVDADGPTLAAAVLAADAEGPRPAAAALIPRLLPGRFGREWTELLVDLAGSPPPPTAPGWVAMAGTFARSAFDQVVAGNPIAPPNVRAARKATCEACPLLDKAKDQCRSCGCLAMDLKRSWATSACPEGHWPAVEA